MPTESLRRASALPPTSPPTPARVQVLRHHQVCDKLQVSSAKLFAMCADGVFPKPFTIVPGGRAVGWLAADVDAWILNRHDMGGSE
jgi:predicted DNA-binding transcriptional regulator AlpA